MRKLLICAGLILLLLALGWWGYKHFVTVQVRDKDGMERELGIWRQTDVQAYCGRPVGLPLL